MGRSGACSGAADGAVPMTLGEVPCMPPGVDEADMDGPGFERGRTSWKDSGKGIEPNGDRPAVLTRPSHPATCPPPTVKLMRGV